MAISVTIGIVVIIIIIAIARMQFLTICEFPCPVPFQHDR